MEGWIKIHRKLIDNPLWHSERFTKSQAWIDLLLLANHKPNTIFIRGNEVKTERGELCWSMLSLSKRWKWNRRTVDKFLSWLEKQEMIHNRKSPLTTIISIKNYDSYQTDAQQMHNRVHNRVHTNKNDKNEKNNNIGGFFENIMPDSLKNFPGFVEIWVEWINYKKEKRDRITLSTAKKQFVKLQTYADPIAIINNAIEKGWKGLYDLPANGNNGNGKSDHNETLVQHIGY
jgi:hypothetical protein